MNTVYVIRDTEAGNIIEQVSSIEEGKKIIEGYDATDKKDGTYTDNFYEVAEIDEDDFMRLTGRK